MTINQLIKADIIKRGTIVRLERVEAPYNFTYFDRGREWDEELKAWMRNNIGGCVIANMTCVLVHSPIHMIDGNMAFEETKAIMAIKIIEG